MNKKHPLFIGLFVIFPLMLLLLSIWGYVFKALYDNEIIGQGTSINKSEVEATTIVDLNGDSIDTNTFKATSGIGIITHEFLSGSWIGEEDSNIQFDFLGSNQVEMNYGDLREVVNYQLYDLYGRTNIDILVQFGVSSFRIDFIDNDRLLLFSINKDEEIIINRKTQVSKTATVTNGQMVPDPILQQLILQVLGKSSKDTEITQKDLFGLTELPTTEGVTDLTGLAWAYNLNSINLTDSNATDFSPIKDLRRLRYIEYQSKLIDEEKMNKLLTLGLIYDLTLDLSYSEFTSWDVAKQLVQNGNFPFMKTLIVVDTNLDESNINDLQEARNGLKVITQFNGEQNQYLATLLTY